MKFTQKAVRRWFAAALALLLTFTLALPAMAATAEAEDLTITIKNNKGLPSMRAGQFTAYQLFKGTPHEETEKNPGGTSGLEDWQKPNDWNGENWDNYTLADVKWGDDVKAEELVKALITLTEDDQKKWPEFFTSEKEGGANYFTLIAKFQEPGSEQKFAAGEVDAAAAKLAYLLQEHNNNAFLQAFSKFVVEGKNGDGSGFLNENAGVKSSLKVSAGLQDGMPDASKDESTIDLKSKGAGYYLIVDTGDHTSPEHKNEATSEYILAVLANQTIQLKASIPTVDKHIVKPAGDSEYTDVKGDAAGISDQVIFKLTGTLPKNFNDYDTYFYEFNDTLSKGLEFGEIDTVTVTLTTTEDGKDTTSTYLIAETDSEGNDGTYYSLSKPIKADEDGKTTFTVQFPDLMKLKGAKSPAEEAAPTDEIPWDKVSVENMTKVEIVVTYFATVTSDAVIGSAGNPNDVYLKYSNDPNSNEQGETYEVEVKVYSFGLDLTKKASDTGAGLSGASFVLTKKGVNEKGEEVTLYAQFADAEDDSEPETTPKSKKLVKWVDETEYKEAVKGEEGSESELSTTDFYLTSGAEGKLPNVLGLDEGTYTLVEVVTPAGYNTMDPFTFTIEASINEAGRLTKVTYTHDDQKKEYPSTGGTETDSAVFTSGLLPDTLVNQKAPFLPFTGGMGSTLIYLAGALLIAGAAVTTVVVVVRKRSKTHA